MSSLKILGSILQVISDSGQNGIEEFILFRMPELKFANCELKEKCAELIECGLVTIYRSESYIMTDKGQIFYTEFKKFEDALKKLDLWC